jgi:hypothetical protein
VEAALGVARRYADRAVEAARPLGPPGEALGALGHHLLDDLDT